MHHRLLAATAALGLAGAAFGAGLAWAVPVADPVGDNCKDQGGFVACSNDILSVDAQVVGSDVVFTITTNPAPDTPLPPDFPAHDFFWPSIALNFTNPVFTVNNPDRQVARMGATNNLPDGYYLSSFAPNPLPLTWSVSGQTLAVTVPMSAFPAGTTQLYYVVGTGTTGELPQQRPDIFPNTGSAALALSGGGATPPANPPPAAPAQPITTPAAPLAPQTTSAPLSSLAVLGSLGGIPARQPLGKAVKGSLNLKGAAQKLVITGLVPSKFMTPTTKGRRSLHAVGLRQVGSVVRSNLPAGKLAFKLPLSAKARAAFASRSTVPLTIRVTLSAPGQAPATLTRSVKLVASKKV